jgi:hypothetical protein
LAFFLSSELLGPAALPIEAFFARQNATLLLLLDKTLTKVQKSKRELKREFATTHVATTISCPKRRV